MNDLSNETKVVNEIPWYIMNRVEFVKCLLEGITIRQFPDVEYYPIPFLYDTSKMKFDMGNTNIKDVHRFIYNKLETLLDREFMSNWTNGNNNGASFQEAYNLIESKYGRGTFNSVYEDIQVILCSVLGYSNDDLAIIHSPRETISNVAINQDEITRSLIMSNLHVCQKMYDKEKALRDAIEELTAITYAKEANHTSLK